MHKNDIVFSFLFYNFFILKNQEKQLKISRIFFFDFFYIKKSIKKFWKKLKNKNKTKIKFLSLSLSLQFKLDLNLSLSLACLRWHGAINGGERDFALGESEDGTSRLCCGDEWLGFFSAIGERDLRDFLLWVTNSDRGQEQVDLFHFPLPSPPLSLLCGYSHLFFIC